MTNNARAAAQDATVATTPNRDLSPERVAAKAAAAVVYHKRELAAAEEAVARLEGKGDKLRAMADDADAALEEARAAATDAADRVADAEHYAEAVCGGDR